MPLALINQVLEISKIEAGRTTLEMLDVDIHRLFDELSDLFRLRAAEKGLRLVFERRPDVPQYIRTDVVKLRQVLLNLFSNALKFTETGGITASIKRLRANVDDGNHAQSSRVNLQFSIQDTGYGIAPEELVQVFEPFVQTATGRQTREGTGLGLAISRKFVQLLGGNITVQSEPGKGSTFVFTVPCEVSAASAVWRMPAARRVVALEPGQPRYRLLIVDDQPDNRQVLCALFHSLGFEVREANNGQEAIDSVQAWQPQLIWMDMRMPVMDGYEATRHIRKDERPNTKHESRLLR